MVIELLSRARVQMVALATAMLLGASPAAAAIIWSAPTDSTGHSSDVITTGDLLFAATFGAETTVNGVTFGNVGLGAPNTPNYGVLSNYGQFGPEWDPEYRTLVASTAYVTPPSQLELILGVLPSGSYLMQLFMPQWDANWATTFSLNGVSSAPVQAGGSIAGGPNFPARRMPQWVSVAFDADGATDFRLLTEGPTSYQLLAAFQFRTAEPNAVIPEPSTWAMMVLGFGLAGVAFRSHSRRRAAVAA